MELETVLPERFADELAGVAADARELDELLAELWQRNRLLSATAALHALLFVAFVAGLALDPRTIGGDPAWLKPAKFAGSIALLTATLAWPSEHLPVGERRLRRLSLAFGAIAVVEITLIGTQAARGVQSHFNDSTTLNLAIYGAMGLAISLLFALVVLVLAITLYRSLVVAPAFALGIRAGLAVFALGAAGYAGLWLAALGHAAWPVVAG